MQKNRGNDYRFGKRNSYQPGRRFGGRPRPKSRPSFDPSMFVRTGENVVDEVFVPQHTFTSWDLASQLQQNIVAKGYTTPTPIQDQGIPAILAGKDVVGLANTGTGKTAAFLIPLINKALLNRQTRVLVIAPTRELAMQINDEFRQLATGLDIYSAVCIGGMNIGRQIAALRRRPQFVIGTPGRLQDIESQRILNMQDFGTIVLDEVDRMLDMGFVHEIKQIFSKLPAQKQAVFFSATMPANVERVVRELQKNPVRISVKTRDAAASVNQDVVRLAGREKVGVLVDLLTSIDKAIVFVRTKRGVDKLARDLYTKGVDVGAIHGNKSQNHRQRVISQFKASRIKVLLATDVASRGIDVPDVTHVINFDLPETYEDYIHRIGRTGRANHNGVALTFLD